MCASHYSASGTCLMDAGRLQRVAITSWEGGVTNEVVVLACIASMTSSIPTSFLLDPALSLKACKQLAVFVGCVLCTVSMISKSLKLLVIDHIPDTRHTSRGRVKIISHLHVL